MPVHPAVVLLLLAGVPWARDYGQAFGQAEGQGRPVLVFFRADCGGGNRPQNPIEVGGPIEHQEGLSECDLMQQDVWEAADVAKAAERFLPVVVEGGDRTLQVRYQAVRMPTTLVTDPWGNEIFRSTGYIPRDKIARILQAVPPDFSSLAPAGRALKADPANWSALVAAAHFYEGAGLPQVSERLYVKALSGPRADDVAAWRQAVIARGLNLMVRLQNSAEAAALFEKELGVAPTGPSSDALLLGIVNARLQDGRRKEADAAYQKMVRDFPESPFTARAKQNLEATKK
jgi:tetratricopeptide (TPR) repeat protein